MGDDWKYVCFEMAGAVTAILFPPHLGHNEVAARFRPTEPVSAGFVRLDPEAQALVCYGRSDSLKLESRDEDNFYVNRLMPRG